MARARPKYSMSNYGRFKEGVTLAGIPISTPEGGHVFWVDSNAPGASQGPGTDGGRPGRMGSWNTPFATLDAALSFCVADRGDVIFIKPNHAETTTGAGGVTFDKAGVYVIGLGIYDQRPAFLIDGAASSVLVTAADVWIENIVFSAGHADLAYCISVTAKGCHIVNCQFQENTPTENFKTAVQIGGTVDNDADGCVVAGCFIHMADTADLMAISIVKEADDVKIVGNRIYGMFDSGTKNAIDGAAAEVCLNLLVADNLISSTLNASASCITIDNTASTGWMANNFAQHLDTAGATPFVGASIGMFQNFNSTKPGTKSGYLLPAVDS